MDESSRIRRCLNYIEKVSTSKFMDNELLRTLNQKLAEVNSVNELEDLTMKLSKTLMFKHGCLNISQMI